MNFEDRIIIQPKSLFERPELIQEILRKKRAIVDDFRVDEKDFTDIYSEEEIAKDILELERLEKIWEENNSLQEKYNKNIASFLEAVFVDQIEVNNWLGDHCETMPASRYDDIKNGVDMVSIFNNAEENKYLGLGIDVTFASDSKALIKKLDSVKSVIREGELPKLKYFRDPETGEHKELAVPKVIVGTRLSSAENLLKLWVSKTEDKNKKLQEHSIQSKIILESLYQLKYFYEYALNLAENSKENKKIESYKEVAHNYAEMYNIFYDIYESKKELIEKHINEVADDIVYQTIAEYTGNKESK